MTIKCSQGHNKVCANIIQLKKIKIDNIFFEYGFQFKQMLIYVSYLTK